MTTFATFHVEKKIEDIKAINALNRSLRKQYHKLIELMFRSAKLFHPDCQQVVLSDTQSQFSYLDSSINVFRSEIAPDEPMMYSRLASQINYVRAQGAYNNIVTLDSDILINGNIDGIFEEDFDIALTYRARKDMPINWGVMFISNRRPDRVIHFLEKILAVYKTTYFESDIFWCDQYALMDVIGMDTFFQRESDWIEVEGITIKLVPCEVYNYSPNDEAKGLLRPFVKEKILHFKGNRKRFIELYWKAYLAQRENMRPRALYDSFRNRLQLAYAAFLEAGIKRKRRIMNTLGKIKQPAS